MQLSSGQIALWCGNFLTATAHRLRAADSPRSRLRGGSASRRGTYRVLARSSAAEEASAPAPEPWTADELQRMTEEEYAAQEEDVGDTWRQDFEDDPEELYEYTDRAYQEHQDLLDRILQLNEQEAQVRMHACRAACMNGMHGFFINHFDPGVARNGYSSMLPSPQASAGAMHDARRCHAWPIQWPCGYHATLATPTLPPACRIAVP